MLHKRQSVSLFINLPNELILYIVDFLDLYDIIKLYQCCKRLQSVIDTNHYIGKHTIYNETATEYYTYIWVNGMDIKHGEYKLYAYDNYNKDQYGEATLILAKHYNYRFGKKYGMCIKHSIRMGITRWRMYKSGIKCGRQIIRNIFGNILKVKNYNKHGYTYGTTISYYESDSKSSPKRIYKITKYNRKAKLYYVKQYDRDGLLTTKYSYKINESRNKVLEGEHITYGYMWSK